MTASAVPVVPLLSGGEGGALPHGTGLACGCPERRLQPAHIVDGNREAGYTNSFEIICRDCGNDPRWHPSGPRCPRAGLVLAWWP
jgi:hypothetical protein